MGLWNRVWTSIKNITERGFLSVVIAASSLVNMYAKSGGIDKAHTLFDRMPQTLSGKSTYDKKKVSWDLDLFISIIMFQFGSMDALIYSL